MDRIKKEDLDTILEWFTKSDLSSATVEYDQKGAFRVEISRNPSPQAVHVAPPVIQQAPASVSAPVTNASPAEASNNATDSASGAKPDNVKTVNAPIVGTFYRSSNPDTPPFVQVGDKVKKGQVLCILEAMKVMNELEAEYDMEIVSILVENSNLIEYDQPLFEVIPL